MLFYIDFTGLNTESYYEEGNYIDPRPSHDNFYYEKQTETLEPVFYVVL